MADQEDNTIEVKRRRQGSSSGPDSSERAEMPGRQRESGSGGGNRSGGGGGGVTKGLPVGVVILILICYGLYSLFFSDDSSKTADNGSESTSIPVEDTSAPTTAVQAAPTTRPAKPTATSATSGAKKGQTWTVMLYQDADDQILEEDIMIDLNEAERVGSSDRVQIVSQIDRYKGAYKGDGNWTSTRRYHLTQDDDLFKVNSELVQDLGEKNMADGATLADFITWSAKTYPADHYVLVLSDHGMGWPGGMSDSVGPAKSPNQAPLASAFEGDQLYLNELDKTLASATKSVGKFELIGMDACLMSHIEVLAALEPYAHYAVLSQETEPALGWAYTSFLQALVDNPDMSGADLGKKIVSSYIKDDQRINDPQARADLLRANGSGQASAAALGKEYERDVTLTAADLTGVPGLIKNLNTLAFNLQSEQQETVAGARSHSPTFTNVFGKNGKSPYIDLGGFAALLKREGVSDKTSKAADQLLASLKSTVLAEKHGSLKSGATGVSIYFPTSSLYRSDIGGAKSYTMIANRFAETSQWDDFLAFHYNKIGFKADAQQPVAPQSGAPRRAPGLGEIQVSAITLSGKTASPGKPVTLTTKVSGTNIGYVYLFVGYRDKGSDSIFKADTDFLSSPNAKSLDGLFYPVWNGDKPFNLKLDWDPSVFQISDGSTTAVALFTPRTYGAAAEDAVYTVDGLYHYADGSTRSARLYFRNGVMTQVFGFTDDNETGGTREIIPQAGDTFTILEQWLDVDASGKVTQAAAQEGVTLTFGDKPFSWKESYAAAGSYLVGFIIEDLDGNSQAVYTTVTVK